MVSTRSIYNTKYAQMKISLPPIVTSHSFSKEESRRKIKHAVSRIDPPHGLLAWDGCTGFHGRRIDEIFLLFMWIHILQQGIWDMETRKLSRTPSAKNSSIQFRPLPSQLLSNSENPVLFKPLELAERLDSLASAGQDTEGVEADL
jgi:hypothetical protein